MQALKMMKQGSGLCLIMIAVLVTSGSSFVTRAVCDKRCTCDTQNHRVDCSNAGLTHIPWDLPDPSGLKQLDLSGNDIREIIAEVVSYLNLEYLDLSNNGLLQVEDGVFGGLSQLKFLYLQNNHLTSVKRIQFNGLNSLAYLDLSHNDLKYLDKDVFSDMKNLEDLNLAGNKLNSIHGDAFEGLESLRYLALSDNILTAVPVQALERTPTLTSLKLDFNKIENIDNFILESLPGLRTLNLEGNSIMRLSNNAFQRETSFGQGHLETLILKNNKLDRIPSRALNHLSSLVTLDLNMNGIVMVGPDAFRGMPRLRVIRLSYLPQLEVVRNYAFTELPKLVSVEMHSNPKLRVVEEGAFLATPNLREVDLHANNLETIGSNLLQWESLNRVDLRHNPWNCDCHLEWVQQIVLNMSSNMGEDVQCSTPNKVASISVADLSSSDFMCRKEGHQFEDRIMIAIIGGISLILFLIMIILLYKNKYLVCCTPRRQASYHTQINVLDRRSTSVKDVESQRSEERPVIAQCGDSQSNEDCA